MSARHSVLVKERTVCDRLSQFTACVLKLQLLMLFLCFAGCQVGVLNTRARHSAHQQKVCPCMTPVTLDCLRPDPATVHAVAVLAA